MLMIKRSVLVFGLLVLLANCATEAPTLPEMAKSSPADAPQDPALQKASEEILPGSVLNYFYQLNPRGSGKPFASFFFKVKDVENGYLRVGSDTEGYVVYSLFKGKSKDLVVEQKTVCNVSCKQEFKAYAFKKGKFSTKVNFESLYPKSTVVKVWGKAKTKLPKIDKSETLENWLRLPQKGQSIETLLVDRTYAMAPVYKTGSLDWTGTRFKFSKLSAPEALTVPEKEIF